MAQTPIKSSELIESGALDPFIKDIKNLNSQLELTNKELEEIAKRSQKAAKGLNASKAGDMQKAVTLNKEMTKAIIDQERVQQAQIRTKKALIGLENAQDKQRRKELKQREQLTNAYKQESKRLNDLRNAWKNLAAQNRENGKVGRSLLKEITQLDNKLKRIDATVGQHQRNVGNYTGALGGLNARLKQSISLLARFGVVLSGAQILRDATGILVDFNQAQADLAAISGSSAEELAKLEKQAKQLGETTQFSASEIANMQIELAKLGFTTEQIMLSTGGVSDFAAAVGVDLPEAAQLAGATLRAFNLDASEMERVVSTLGVSTTKSALDFSFLNTAMSTVAPVANSFGFNVEEVTSLLGGLANAGFDASSAATATRNILLNLADANGDLAQALGGPVENLDDLLAGLETLNAQGIDLAETLELTDKRSVAAFNTFLTNTGTIKELKTSVTDANKELEEMADKRLDSVQGQLKLLRSAWEGYILGVDEAGGVSNKLKNIIGFLARNLATILNVVISLVKGYLTYKATILAITAAQKAHNLVMLAQDKGLKGLIKSLFTATTATKGATTAQQGFNTAVKANPIGLLIGVLTTAISLLWDYGDAANFAEEQQQKLNLAVEEGNKIAAVQISQQQAALDQQTQSRIKELFDAKVSEAEIVKTVAEEYKQQALAQQEATKARIEELNVQANQLKNNPIILASINAERLELIKYLESSTQLTGSQGALQQKILDFLDSLKFKTKGITTETGGTTEQIKEQLIKVDLLNDLLEEQKALQSELNKELEISGGHETAITKNLREQIKALDDMIIVRRDARAIDAPLQDIDETVTPIPGIGAKTPEQLQAEWEKMREFEKANEEALIKQREAFFESLRQLTEDLTQLVEWGVDRQIKQLERLEEAERKKYESALNREQQIIELRANGAANTEESLAFERQAQAEALAEQEKIAQRKQRLELITASINLFNSQVQAGNGNPLGGTIADISTLVGFLNSIPAFWEGTETTVGDKLGNKVSNGRDGILARVDKDEIILNKEKSDKLRGMTTDDITTAALMYKQGAYDSSIVINKTREGSTEAETIAEMREMNKHLQNISNKPTSQLGIEELAGIMKIQQKISSSRKTITKTKFIRPGR